MATLTITKINSTERTSQRTGKPFTSLSIKTVEHGDKWLSGFGNAVTKSWREGDKVDVVVTEVAKDGKAYLNFALPERKFSQGGFTDSDRKMLEEALTLLKRIAPPDNF